MLSLTDGSVSIGLLNILCRNHECGSYHPERRVCGRQRRQRGGLGKCIAITLYEYPPRIHQGRRFNRQGCIQSDTPWQPNTSASPKRTNNGLTHGRSANKSRTAVSSGACSTLPKRPTSPTRTDRSHAQLKAQLSAFKEQHVGVSVSTPLAGIKPSLAESGASGLFGGKSATDNRYVSTQKSSGTSEWSNDQTDRRYANCVRCGCIDSIHRAAGGFCAECYAEVRGEQ